MNTTITIPIRTVSEANRASHEHWRARQKRAKEQRGVTLLACRAGLVRPELPCVVTLTRIAPRSLDAGGNAGGSLKHVQDGVADFLGIDDRDPRVTYVYAQERGKPKEYAVRIEVHAGMVVETRIVAAQAAGGGE